MLLLSVLMKFVISYMIIVNNMQFIVLLHVFAVQT